LYGLAQSTEALRYKSSQGIEIIQNRAAQAAPPADKPNSAVPAPANSPRAVANTASKVDAASPVKLVALSPSGGLITPAPAAERDRSHVVSTKAQGLRDAERLEILQQELSKEKSLHAHTLKTLQTPELKAKLSDEEGQRYAFMLGLHEQNIAALTKEISRIPVAR
jgi:hypothetical protein